MYADAKTELKNILALVGDCPENLREKCFEILLKGYVDRQTKPAPSPTPEAPPPPPPPPPPGAGTIPESVRPRLETMAKRLGIPANKMAALFDFTVEPFAYHALSVPGKTSAAKIRNVALLVAVRSYLVDGRWRADWTETQSMGIDQNCYDRTNITKNLSHEYFTSASVEGGIVLSGAGQKQAEALLSSIAAPQ